MVICYFTATGNSLYVARRIGGRLLSIPQLMRQETISIEDEAVGIVCPVYNVEFPMMVREFIAERTFIPTISSWCYVWGRNRGGLCTCKAGGGGSRTEPQLCECDSDGGQLYSVL